MPRVKPDHWLLLFATVVAVAGAAVYVSPAAFVDYLRHGGGFAGFTLVILLFVLIPPLFQKLQLPAAVGLMLVGVGLGPYALHLTEPDNPILELFSSLGRIFLLFVAGLEVDLRVFKATRARSLIFGATTFTLPLLGGVLVGRYFDFEWNSAVLIGSLIASHTLIAYPVLVRLGLTRSELVAVALGATIFTDIASLLVLAVCVSVHTGGFSPIGLAVQLFQFGIFSVLVLVGIPFVGARLMRRFRNDDTAVFSFVFLSLLLASTGAHLIHMEDIVGAFLAGIAVNRVVRHTTVGDRIDFLGQTLFIPSFFMAIGFRLELPIFAATVQTSLPFVLAMVAALFFGKLLAAGTCGRLFRYSLPQTMTLWSVSLPQVAATLAAAMVAYEAMDDLGTRLITEAVLNSIIVLMVVTSVLGPILTERFGRRVVQKESSHAKA